MKEIVIIPGKRLLDNNKLDFEGKQRIHALFRYLRPLYPENIIGKEHDNYYERRDARYIIFSGGITQGRSISEARVMFEFFLKHALEKKLKDKFDFKIMRNSNNREYLVKLNQVLGAKTLWIFLDEKSENTVDNMNYSQEIIDEIKKMEGDEISLLYITQKYHAFRIDINDNSKSRILFAEKITGEQYQKTPNMEYFFRFIHVLQLDKIKTARTIWNKIKYFIKK